MNLFTSGIKRIFSVPAGRLARAFVVATAVLLLGLPLFAQQNLGQISGRVTDQTGGVIAGTPVTVTNVATGVVRRLTTDRAGAYSAPALIPGTYTVSVSAPGFRTFVRKDVLIETGKSVRIDVQLVPGAVTQTVQVTGAVPMVNTTSATLGGTLSNQTINNLPLIGRNFTNLLQLRPGVGSYQGGGGWTMSTNGLRVDAESYLVDGMDDNETFLGQNVIDSPGIAGDAATILPIDAISEFNVEENPKAEFGFSSGSVTNVGIKSGTNQVHGTAYAYGRSGSWDARNYFNNGPSLPLGLEQWGGTVGGPIVKNKLFYFAGFEEQRYALGISLPVVEPTNLPGDPSVSIPAAEQALANQNIPLSPLSLQLLPLFGTSPNANGNITTNNLTTTNLSDNVLGKVNYNINSRNTLNVFYFFGNDNLIAEDFPVLQPEFLTHMGQRSQTVLGDWTWMPNARWVNEARFGFLRFNQPARPVDQNVPASHYGINTGVTNPVSGGLPLIFVSGLGGGASFGSGIGANASWPHYFGPHENYDWVDQVSYLRGNHTFKWGGEVRFAAMSDNALSFSRGDINFFGGNAFSGSTGLEDFLAGAPTFALLNVGNDLRRFHETYYALFAQDDWRVTPRVTLNLGVRWEYTTPLSETNNLLGNWNPTQGFFSAGGSQGSTVYNRQKANFAPRLGLAWDIFGNGKTVLRAGGGMYYDSVAASTFAFNPVNLKNFPTNGIESNPTGAYFVNSAGVATQSNPNGIQSGTLFLPVLNWTTAGPVFPIHPVACGDGVTTVTSGPASLIGIPPAPCSIFAVTKNFKTPYVADWTLSLEHAINNRLSLDVAYVGNHGQNLTSVVDANQPDPATGAAPYGNSFPYLGVINMLGNQYRSNYNGLQATLTGRNYHRMTFVLGYTYSHALDQMSFSHFPVTPQNSLDPGAEYASSDIDVRHRATLSWSYNVPGINSPAEILRGWVLNTIVVLQSPMPWASFDTANNISNTGELMDRWDFFGNPNSFSGHGHTSIPYSGEPNFPAASMAACVAAAGMVPNGPGGTTGLESLNQFGCFAEGNNVLVPPAIGTFGFTGRNIFRDSGFYNMDFSIFKDFKFKERLTAQFRAEFFNVLNHPNFANPYGGITGWGPAFSSDPSAPANFGCGCRTPDVAQTDPVLGSGGPRAIQLGLKLIF
ncbi:MAG TPA: TonB-dependent receptor [Candidatus Dormibacteraeota bacterium]|nr:TonB-dependent receptor [Candidatus Dormibacteraeota bacterium]